MKSTMAIDTRIQVVSPLSMREQSAAGLQASGGMMCDQIKRMPRKQGQMM